MKILQIVHGFPPKKLGGVEILTYNLSKELSKKHEVHIFYPQIIEECQSSVLLNFKMDNLILHQLNIFYPYKNFYKKNPIKRLRHFNFGINFELGMNKQCEKEFKKILKQLKPDIIHFQHLLGLSLSLPLIAKNYAPTILTLHDYWLICPTTHFLNCNSKICNSPSKQNCTICLSVPFKKVIVEFDKKFKIPIYLQRISIHLFEKWIGIKIKKRLSVIKKIIMSVDKIVPTSNSIMKKFIENSFIEQNALKNDKIIKLGYGINVSELAEVNKSFSDKIRFGFIGTMSERKGLHILIEAFNRLNSSESILYIYGSAYTDNYSKNLLDKIKNNLNIKFMGSFFKNVKEPYSNIDILIVPSVTYEGYGLVVQEAFAAKTPVIASNIPALNEFVKDMENGLLFNTGDINDLYDKMKIIIDKPGLIEQFKVNIPSVKSIQQYAEEFESIYQKCMEKK